jgi:hypothetical protein
MELFNNIYIVSLVGNLFLSISLFLLIDLLIQSGLFGSNLKDKWLSFLKDDYSGFKIFWFVFWTYIFFSICFSDLKDVLYCMSDDLDKSGLAGGGLEAKNLKISNLDVAAEKLGEAGLYGTAMLAASRLMKSSALPIGGKVVASIATGAGALASYKIIQGVSSSNRPRPKIVMEVGSVKTHVGVSTNNPSIEKNYPAKSMLDPLDNASSGDKEYYIMSSQDFDVLNWDLILHLVILVLIINVIIFLVMKIMSENNINIEVVKKLPFGCYIYFVLNKLKILWYKVTIVWIFLWLFLIFIFTSISAWSIYMVINNLG